MQAEKRRYLLALERALPMPMRRLLRRIGHYPPPHRGIAFGDLRRTAPIDRDFGFNRGMPVDRYYIETFLSRHAGDIRGDVLEIGDNAYTLQFGGDQIGRSYVLHVTPGNPLADYVADLATADELPADAFDCVILTQTLHLIFDFEAALRHLHRIVRPGGVLLVTVPGITPVDQHEWHDTWYWSFTSMAVSRLLAESFGPGTGVTEFGNVLTATAFLQGLAADELTPDELQVYDPAYPVLVAARAQKPVASADTTVDVTA